MRISDWSSDGFSSDLPLIAAHARDGRRPGEVGVDEIVHYVGAEAVLVIAHVMRDADPVGDPARIVDVLAGATRPRPSRGRPVVVELARHADHVAALATQQATGPGAVDAAGHLPD